MNNKIPKNNKELIEEISNFEFQNKPPEKKKSKIGIIILVIVIFILFFLCFSWPTIDKPIIYIYPEEDMDITVKLGNPQLITSSYPKYEKEWNIHVDTTGNIYDYKTNRNYYGLYWEGKDKTPLNMEEGFIVEGKDITEFLEAKLELLGLNEKEINEFIIYWLPRLENNKYNFIRFKTPDEINNYMPLEFSKEPDTLIRIMVDFKPLNKKIKVKEQTLEKKERKGFTIVEWGARLN